MEHGIIVKDSNGQAESAIDIFFHGERASSHCLYRDKYGLKFAQVVGVTYSDIVKPIIFLLKFCIFYFIVLIFEIVYCKIDQEYRPKRMVRRIRNKPRYNINHHSIVRSK